MADTIKSSIHINPVDTRISEDGLRLIKEWVLKKIGKQRIYLNGELAKMH